MRRTFFMLAAALLAALPPAVAAAGHGDPAPREGSPSVAATLAPGVESLVDHASPGALLDLIVTLDRPADRRMETDLSRLGVWSRTFEQLPSAASNVSIDPRYVDPLGNPRPVISYHLDDYTLAGMAAATDVYRQVFRRAGIQDCTNPEDGTWFPSCSCPVEVYCKHAYAVAWSLLTAGETRPTSAVRATPAPVGSGALRRLREATHTWERQQAVYAGIVEHREIEILQRAQ